MTVYGFKDMRIARELKAIAKANLTGRPTSMFKGVTSVQAKRKAYRTGWYEVVTDITAATEGPPMVPGKGNVKAKHIDIEDSYVDDKKDIRGAIGTTADIIREARNKSLDNTYAVGEELYCIEDSEGVLWASPWTDQHSVKIATLDADCPPDTIANLTQQVDDGGGQMADAGTIQGYNVHPITWKAGLLMKVFKCAGWDMDLIEPWEWRDCDPTPAGSMAFDLTANGGVGEPLDGPLNGVATYLLDGRYWHSTPGTPVDLTMDPTTGQVVINSAGRYNMTIQIGFVHNTSTSRERVAQIALYDTVAAGVVGNPGLIGVARNTESTTYSTTILLDATNVPTSPLMLQMGGGGAGVEEIGAVEIFSLGWTLVKI